MNLEEIKRIANARTKGGKWEIAEGCWGIIKSEERYSVIEFDSCSNADQEFVVMAANNIDAFLDCAEFVKNLAPAWLPPTIRENRHRILRALENP